MLKRTAVNLSLFVVTTLICLGIAEISLRALGYHGETVFKVGNTMLVDDPVLNWRQTPNTVYYFNDVVFKINERGFRDYVYPYRKGVRTFRILLASDSVGFGTNVQMTDSYPKILEAQLNAQNLPFKIEVLNHSMPGLSIKQKLHIVERYAKDYDPDLVMVDYVVNDVEFESRKDPRREKERETDCSIALLGLPIPCGMESSLKKSALLFFSMQSMEIVLHKMNWEDRNVYYDHVESDYYHRLYASPQKREYLKTVFSQLGEYQKSGIPIVVPIFPLIYDYQKYKWADINELVIRLCRDNNLPYIALLDEYRKFPFNEMRVQRGDFTHPSVKGNQVAAQAIAGMLMKSNLITAHRVSR